MYMQIKCRVLVKLYDARNKPPAEPDAMVVVGVFKWKSPVSPSAQVTL